MSFDTRDIGSLSLTAREVYDAQVEANGGSCDEWEELDEDELNALDRFAAVLTRRLGGPRALPVDALHDHEEPFCGRFYGLADVEGEPGPPSCLYLSEDDAVRELERRQVLPHEDDEWVSGHWAVLIYDVEGLLWNSFEEHPRPPPETSRLWESSCEIDGLRDRLKRACAAEAAARQEIEALRRARERESVPTQPNPASVQEAAARESQSGVTALPPAWRQRHVEEAMTTWRQLPDSERARTYAVLNTLKDSTAINLLAVISGDAPHDLLESLESTTTQPAPAEPLGPEIWPLIIAQTRPFPNARKPDGALDVLSLLADDMQARHEFGIARYGKPLRAFNGRDALRDSYEQRLDGLAYDRQRLEEARGNALESTRHYKAACDFESSFSAALDARRQLFARDGR